MPQSPNLNFFEYYRRLAERHTPRLAFGERGDYATWREAAAAKLVELMGEFPKRVDPNPQVISREENEGIIRERIVIEAEPEMAIACVVLRPAALPKDHSGRAIITVHGHGPYAKEAVVYSGTARTSPIEDVPTDDLAGHVQKLNYNYGEQLARRGFLTLSPDLRGFGERAGAAPEFKRDRDPCNLHFLLGAMLGRFPLTLNVFDIGCCLRYLQQRPEIDPARVGMMGLSLGGTLTTFAGAMLPEIRCANISGYLHPWRTSAFERWNTCGLQIVPHIHTWFEPHDIAGLIAPRPLLIEMGAEDRCFRIEDQRRSFAALGRIYEAAGARDRLWLDSHAGGHAFSSTRAFDFFERFL